MADIDDRNALGLEILDDAEQGLHLVRRQGRGRLVQDEHLAVRRDRLGDFHRLHLGNGQIAKALLGIKVHANLFEQLRGILIHFRMIDHRDASQQLLHRIAANVDVFRNAALRHGLEFLVHHRDAHIQRLQRIGDIYLLALVENFALVHLVNAKHALHQRGLAGAVLAHQRVNRAGPELELSMVKRLYARELLDNAPHFKSIFRHESASPFIPI